MRQNVVLCGNGLNEYRFTHRLQFFHYKLKAQQVAQTSCFMYIYAQEKKSFSGTNKKQCYH